MHVLKKKYFFSASISASAIALYVTMYSLLISYGCKEMFDHRFLLIAYCEPCVAVMIIGYCGYCRNDPV